MVSEGEDRLDWCCLVTGGLGYGYWFRANRSHASPKGILFLVLLAWVCRCRLSLLNTVHVGLGLKPSVYEPWMGLQIADARVSPTTRNDIVLAHNLKSNDVRTLPALFLPHGT